MNLELGAAVYIAWWDAGLEDWYGQRGLTQGVLDLTGGAA